MLYVNLTGITGPPSNILPTCPDPLLSGSGETCLSFDQCLRHSAQQVAGRPQKGVSRADPRAAAALPVMCSCDSLAGTSDTSAWCGMTGCADMEYCTVSPCLIETWSCATRRVGCLNSFNPTPPTPTLFPGTATPRPQCSGLNREPACFLFSLFLYPSLLSLSLLFSSQ